MILFNVRTDMADEASAIYKREKSRIDGVETDYSNEESISVSKVYITNENGERAIGKPVGTYVTIDSPDIRKNDENICEKTISILTRELKNMMKLKENSTVLVVGLGNWNVTPDALGPKVVSMLKVTRHLFQHLPESVDDDMRPMCAVSPGVLGITGIETGEIVKGVVDMVKPDIVIAIDALASRRMDRISTSIQLADTGISPGSGIGNKRKALNEEYLGVPVIAMGVPTVVDAATVANDAIELLIECIDKNLDDTSNLKSFVKVFDNDGRYSLIKEVLSPYVGDLVVTPKEVDGIIEEVSHIIASGINNAVLNNSESVQKPMV